MVFTTARGLLRLSLRPRLRLTPGIPTVPTDWVTTDSATEPMDTGTPMPTMVFTTARGLLRLSLRPMLRLTPGTPMVPTDTDWVTTDSATEPMVTPMLTATTTARGPLMLSLSQRLMLMLTTGTSYGARPYYGYGLGYRGYGLGYRGYYYG